ncbi:MAG: thioredoxin [Candidatus Thorarchaeota archaeon]|nr:thioredoxin [Candidatus Thorarchaeota archaeon]
MTQKGLRENRLGGLLVILFFTSNQCAWCDIVKEMLENASHELSESTLIYEVNIDRYQSIAEIYGIMMVPTLVSKGNMICGVPTSADLISFLMQSITEPIAVHQEGSPRAIIRPASRIKRLSTELRSEPKQKSSEQVGPVESWRV